MMTQSEFIKHLRTIAKTHDGSNWELGDALSDGETVFGRKPAYDLAQKATGWHRISLYRIAGVASYFPKPLRFGNLSWSVYVMLRSFPLPFLDRFIPKIADSELSAKLLREKACAEFGSDPQAWRKQTKFRTVRIKTELCDKIVERSGSMKVTGLVAEILESWLTGEKCERQPASNNKTREWNQKVKDACEQRPEAPNQPVGTNPSDVPASDDTSPCSKTPAAPDSPKPRRRQNGSEGFKPKEKRERELRLQWVPCSKRSALNGVVAIRANSQRADCFATLEEAQAAEEKYFLEKKYHNDVTFCVVCDAHHVTHRY